MRARNFVILASVLPAALALSACGGGSKTDGNDVLVTDMGNIGMAEGTVSDNMTAIDGATMGGDAPLANDMSGDDSGGNAQ